MCCGRVLLGNAMRRATSWGQNPGGMYVGEYVATNYLGWRGKERGMEGEKEGGRETRKRKGDGRTGERRVGWWKVHEKRL